MHEGIYLIAYPTKEKPESATLYHLNFKEQKLIKIKEGILSVDKVNMAKDGTLEIETKNYHLKETIIIKNDIAK